jgi:hypothetical protein
MIWKLLLTAAVIVGAYLLIRARLQGQRPPPTARARRDPLLPPGLMRAAAYGVLAVLVIGSGWYLYDQWETRHTVVTVQVVNAHTGAITPYQARRKDIGGRGFRTLDGREVRLADVERMVLNPEGQGL